MKNISQLGSSFLQVTIIGAVLAGLGVYLMQTTQQQNKIAKSAETKGAYGILKKEISEAIASSETCQMTLQKYFSDPIETDMKQMEIAGIKTMYNSAVTEMYMPDQEMFNLKIKSIKLMMPNDYVADDSMHMQSADLAVFIEPSLETTSANSTYGSPNIAVKIPLFLFMHNKKIMMCLSLDAQTVIDALRESCSRLGGNFDEVAGICRELHGANGLVMREVRDHFCSASGDSASCSAHPYAGLDCRNYKNPTPVVADKNNWVLRGIRQDGTPDCACVPVKECEDPASHCKGIDLGTDWCFNDCGEGTKEDGICAACNTSDWSPAPDTRCEGIAFTQTNGCGETQPSMGTMKDNWTPKASEVCEGETFTQYSSCGAAPKYNVAGTKDCSCAPISRPHNWSEIIAGKTYNCAETTAAGTTVLKHKEKLSLTTQLTDENQGTSDLECNNGILTKVEKCSSLPKTLSCNILYQYKNKNRVSSPTQNGSWAFVEHGREENCEGAFCGVKVGISCTGDADVRISYQYKEFSTSTPEQTTPWSTPDGSPKWGPWSEMSRNHHREECANGKLCGVVMKAETRKGGSCKVSYQHRWRFGTSVLNSDGVWSQGTYSDRDDDGCQSSSGCGIRATISCSI